MSETLSAITLEFTAAVAEKRLGKLSGGEAVVSTATGTDLPFGVNDIAVIAGGFGSIKLLNKGQTFEITASGAISVDDIVYGTADGKITATAGGPAVGQALEAATADGDIIEILPLPGLNLPATSTALTVAAPAIVPGSVNVIDSTDNAVDATLADDTVIGRQTKIVMAEASNSSTVTIASHQTSDPEVATFDAVDEYLILEWSGTEYVTVFATATFT